MNAYPSSPVFTPTSDESKSSMKIYNENSHSGAYYLMNVPFQITLEYCSGITDSDYFNFFIASPGNSYSDTQSTQKCLPYYSSRPLHQHDFYELMFVIKGEIIQRIEEKEFFYPAGSCCLINRNLRHAEKFIGTAQIFFLNFSVNFIQEIMNSYKQAFFQEETQMNDSSIFHFIAEDIKQPNQKSYLDFFPTAYNSESASELYHIADSLIRALLFPDFGSTYQIKYLISALLSFLSAPHRYHTTPVKLDSKADFLLFCRISHILEDTNGRISRQELESHFHYTGDYLNRIVKKYSGMSLFDYGMTFCLEKAKELLLKSNTSISEIAVMLKFTNRSHFYKLFKERYGMTPKEYRLSHSR